MPEENIFAASATEMTFGPDLDQQAAAAYQNAPLETRPPSLAEFKFGIEKVAAKLETAAKCSNVSIPIRREDWLMMALSLYTNMPRIRNMPFGQFVESIVPTVRQNAPAEAARLVRPAVPSQKTLH